jgi:large subunit ribosomal protein L29
MDIEKIRNTTEAELRHQERELSDQLFRLKFQLKMGQTESLEKIRGLRKDIARIKTISRQRELGLPSNAGGASPEGQAMPVQPPKKARAATAVAEKPAKKSVAKAGRGRKLTRKAGKAKTEKK